MKRMTFSEKKEAWWEWHNANPAVWDYFEKFSLDAVRRGTKKISHWLIINRIRWEVYIDTRNTESCSTPKGCWVNTASGST